MMQHFGWRREIGWLVFFVGEGGVYSIQRHDWAIPYILQVLRTGMWHVQVPDLVLLTDTTFSTARLLR